MTKCEFDPQGYKGGMFHCPLCGEMVLAGLPHPPYPERWPPEEKREVPE